MPFGLIYHGCAVALNDGCGNDDSFGNFISQNVVIDFGRNALFFPLRNGFRRVNVSERFFKLVDSFGKRIENTLVLNGEIFDFALYRRVVALNGADKFAVFVSGFFGILSDVLKLGKHRLYLLCRILNFGLHLSLSCGDFTLHFEDNVRLLRGTIFHRFVVIVNVFCHNSTS